MKHEFEAVLKQHEGINGAYLEIPFDVEEVFGAKRVKVIATFDDIQYRGSIVSMGGCYLIGVTQKIREEINKNFGDTVNVTVEKDEEKREVEIPEDLASALNKDKNAKAYFDKLSYSNKKKIVDSIISAKQKETYEKRIIKAMEMLSKGEKMV